MRFGLLQLFENPGAQTDARWLDEHLASLVEGDRLGFDNIWVGEHHFGDYGVCASPTLVLAALAQHTTRARIGSAVLVLPFHHPVRVAEELTLLDIASGGRLDVGVGRGFRAQEFAGYGVDPSQSESLFDESLEIMLSLWRDGAVTFHGRHYDVEVSDFRQRTVQRPHPPVWMAAVSPPSFAKAGRLGLNLLCSTFYGGTVGELAAGVSAYKQALREAGHDIESRRIGFLSLMYVGDTEAEADSVLRDPARWQFEELSRYIPRDPPPGYEHYASLRERALWANWDDLKQRAVAICGDAQSVCDRVAQLEAEIGFTDLICWTHVAGVPTSFAMKSTRRIADEVMPVFTAGEALTA